ncbi:hypothetical protein DENSPDRAFT_840520 [Dentipellis sp. KUC8613]|nr:hypothetical protein DENSPDRAFT_840520 [Dentipellis sp. KUC8613]
MMSVDDSASADALSQALIAQLLEEEMKDMTSARFAERLQLSEAMQKPNGKGKQGEASMPLVNDTTKDVEMDDFAYALQVIADDTRVSSDAVFAAKMQLDNDASFMAGHQYAQQVAAAEKKILLDAEFARKLQDAHDSGQKDLDDESMKDADEVLEKDVVDKIFASDPNSKGKGKGKGKAPSYEQVMDSQSQTNDNQDSPSSPYETCGICLEPFQPTHSPSTATRSANSSNRVQFGLRLPCPGEHGYCISCMQSYIRSRLDPNDDGSASADAIVFPIPCPECRLADWPNGIQDPVAERVLEDKMIDLWHYQRLLDSMPHYYCPNPKCSVRVEVDEDQDDPQAECPACDSLLCVPCRALWHDEMTCEEYQKIPIEDRSPDDLLTLQTIKAENWRRCPKCSYIIELSMGCNHVTCRCRAEFCFKCGSMWDKERQRCTSDPACALWDEDMLLEQQERRRLHDGEIAAPRVVAAPAPPPPYNPVPEQNVQLADLDWINTRALCGRHVFTKLNVRQLRCQYCFVPVDSLRGLQMHLAMARHPLYACCGRLFRNEDNYNRHVRAGTRFGQHVHRVRRD